MRPFDPVHFGSNGRAVRAHRAPLAFSRATACPSPDAPVFGSWRPVQRGDEIAGELLRCDQLPFLKCRPRDIDVPKFIEMAG
jgi:hypothetical protein